MSQEMKMVKIDEIEDKEYQVRSGNDDAAMEDLKSSIRNLGVLQPILCKCDNERFTVVAGHRRYQAAVEIGLEMVPIIIMAGIDEKCWAATISENFIRNDLTPVEQAAAIKDVIDNEVYTKEGLARIMHRSPGWVADQISMCDWPNDVLKSIHDGKISVSAAKNLAKIEDQVAREHLLHYAVENGATARITVAWLQAHQAGAEMQNLEQIEPNGQDITASHIEPHAPCCICGDLLKMINLSYLPICANCNDQVITAVKRELRGGGSPARSIE